MGKGIVAEKGHGVGIELQPENPKARVRVRSTDVHGFGVGGSSRVVEAKGVAMEWRGSENGDAKIRKNSVPP